MALMAANTYLGVSPLDRLPLYQHRKICSVLRIPFGRMQDIVCLDAFTLGKGANVPLQTPVEAYEVRRSHGIRVAESVSSNERALTIVCRPPRHVCLQLLDRA